ncbi:sensor histidine kinase [Paenibacillus eucommiae]|uniref:histidine kinase n=1 Tax=Paenibacillus eucommiae TaxID=1355755 RepID=A0ABS4ITG4_9BACL|nr:histidine kinase [Paenibacillus eucommiae]MBP1990316.1 two-component system sensor histidine kinase YesM [Paenibacillus eucommiae]
MRVLLSWLDNFRLSLYSLKNRMIVVFMLSTLIPLLLIGGISYYSITSILDNKIQGSIRSNLRQVKVSLDNTLSNLNHVSQQLAFDGGVGRSLGKYLESNEILQKSQLEQDIQNNLHLISFTNPSLGVMSYYFADTKEFVLQQQMVDGPINVEELPKLLHTDAITYYGPHPNLNRFIDRTVLSVTRKLEIPGYDNLYVYIETSFRLTEDILNTELSGLQMTHLLVDSNDQITYSELPEQFPIGSHYQAAETGKGFSRSIGNYLFEEEHNQGWKIVAVISESDYYKERNTWIRQFGLLTLLSLAFALGFAWMMWRVVRRPLNHFNREIKQMQNSNFHSPLKLTRITEFDFLLYQFQHMRKRIWELLQEVKQKEKRKTELEIEKLLFQINPHFIHNTLDTIRWLAHSKGLTEIDYLISTLNRVLYYNMGKGGESTVRLEIEALRDYVSLQRIRYDFEFNVHIHADEKLMDLPIPRFILQPLVENSLYHGLKDKTIIEVKLFAEAHYIRIEVKDNGEGMEEEELRRLLESGSAEQRKVGMGIGLYYVSRMLKAQFAGDATLDISSIRGQGTVMQLHIPVTYTNTEVDLTDVEGIGR